MARSSGFHSGNQAGVQYPLAPDVASIGASPLATPGPQFPAMVQLAGSGQVAGGSAASGGGFLQAASDIAYELNKWNPLAIGINSVKALFTGTDTYGVSTSAADAVFNLATIVPVFKGVRVGKSLFNAARISIQAANGLKITGFTGHGVNRAIGSAGRMGVKPNAILDALKNPLKVNNVVTDQLGRQSQRFIGQFGEVVVNPQTGRIISVNPTSSNKAAKLLKQLGL